LPASEVDIDLVLDASSTSDLESNILGFGLTALDLKEINRVSDLHVQDWLCLGLDLVALSELALGSDASSSTSNLESMIIFGFGLECDFNLVEVANFAWAANW